MGNDEKGLIIIVGKKDVSHFTESKKLFKENIKMLKNCHILIE